jgi:hypothetical protein
MIIAGGIYQETCRFPKWDRIFGSGLRAALAISQLSPGSELHSYVARDLERDVTATLEWSRVKSSLVPSDVVFTFEYMHPFDLITIDPEDPEDPEDHKQNSTLTVNGDVVLRFGMMECDVRVTAQRAVYDPQSHYPTFFSDNNSKANDLVIIANQREIFKLVPGKFSETGKCPDNDDIRRAMGQLFDLDQTLRAVLLKDLLGGLTVFQGDEGVQVRNYAAESYFRIGSGDILAAAFTHAWGEKHASVIDEANFASQCLAYAVEGPRLPLDRAGIEAMQLAPESTGKKLYIMVCGNSLELQMMAFHTCGWVKDCGLTAFSDLDDNRLQAKKESHVALILIGEAASYNDIEKKSDELDAAPAVVYWPSGSQEIVTRYFPGAIFSRDYATALYRAMRMPLT